MFKNTKFSKDGASEQKRFSYLYQQERIRLKMIVKISSEPNQTDSPWTTGPTITFLTGEIHSQAFHFFIFCLLDESSL